jgi:fidgetin-like protein 1
MTFFSVSAATLTSKWIGEGEKTVRALFAVAKVHQPSFIFIDEIDAILSSRSSEEHESTRRLKNEFLIQFGGALDSPDVRVTVMGATNRPQDLDEAARRRLPKRVYVPLPEFDTRHHLVKNMLRKEHTNLDNADLAQIGKLTEGYSCSDISQVCREAAMIPMREVDLASRAAISQSEIRPLELRDFVEALKYVKYVTQIVPHARFNS